MGAWIVGLALGLGVGPAAAMAAEPEPARSKAETSESEPAQPKVSEPADDFGGFGSEALADDGDDALDDLGDDELDDLGDDPAFADAGPSPFASFPAREPVPGLPGPERQAAARTGRGMLAAGGVMLGLGVVGRFALEGFWAGPAALRPDEPFGQWSVPVIMVATSFPNLLVIPGLVTTGFGARRHGAWRVATGRRSIDPGRTRRERRIGWGLLGGGLSLWALTRAIGLPVLRHCPTNGCAYGYLESTYWASLGVAIPGAIMVGRAAGERRIDRRISATPMLGPHMRGLALGGRF